MAGKKSVASDALSVNAALSATASLSATYDRVSSQDLSYGIGLGTGYKTGQTSSTDWKDSLRAMSFKGVVFPVTNVVNNSGRNLAKHSYPYRPGQDVVDLGRQPLEITVDAIFVNEPFLVQAFGRDLYPGRFEKLLAAIHEGGSGELVHPVFGTLKAICETYNDTTTTDELNAIRVNLTFVEDDTNVAVPFSVPSSFDAATKAAGLLDDFASSLGVDLGATVGTSFSEVTGQVEGQLSADGRSRDEVASELEHARMNIRSLRNALPELDDPINVEVQANLVSLEASLTIAGTEYLAGTPPVITYRTTTQTTTADIARERYDDPLRATEIEQLNSIPDPLDIPPGTELKIHAF